MKYLFIFLFSINIFAQGEFSSFISYVNSLNDPQQKAAAVDSFITYARSKGIPFIEGNTANFIYRGNKNVVQIAGDFTSWNPNITMSKLPGTNFFFSSRTFELNARLDYKLVTDGTWILDPENPNRVFGGFGPNSELAMPEYVQPWEIKIDSSVSRGTLHFRTISSNYTSKNYGLGIFLPYGYDSLLAAGYPAVYFQDGYEYINLGSATIVMDNLIHFNKIEPLIGIFVQPTNREQEYVFANRDNYRLFFVNELVPYIDSLFNTNPVPAKRAVIGESAGGNISALISYNHAEVFGNCGLHSGAFWPNNYEAYNLIVNGPVKDIRFAFVWGTYESVFTNMRNFRDSLISQGYQNIWSEYPEGHSWGLWRANTDFLLEYFYPGSASSIGEETGLLNDSFRLYQNYPNPFNPSTNINFSVLKNSYVELKVFNSLGSEIATLVKNELNPGDYKVNFNAADLSSGVYYYRIYLDNSAETRKMILIK
jgi:enterochelin esterase-like enzyme